MEQCNRFAEYAISIHALREESDSTLACADLLNL